MFYGNLYVDYQTQCLFQCLLKMVIEITKRSLIHQENQ